MSILENTREALQALFPEQEQEKEQLTPETVDESPEQEIPERQYGVVATDYTVHGSHLDVYCAPEHIVEVATLLDESTFLLESISGADWLKEELLEIIYDFTCFQPKAYRITVRTKVPRSQPSLPSISTLISGADWHERETYDFYGINFEGHPNLTRILLPEDADFHPLLKDYMP